jgi:hypothetical protein
MMTGPLSTLLMLLWTLRTLVAEPPQTPEGGAVRVKVFVVSGKIADPSKVCKGLDAKINGFTPNHVDESKWQPWSQGRIRMCRELDG